MAEENRMSMPGVFGGLMRYDDEYESRFMITPTQVIIFTAIILVFVLILKFVWPLPAIQKGI